jgi:hypothetical protein
MYAKRIYIQYIYSKSEIPQVDAKAATKCDHAPALGTPSAEHVELERELCHCPLRESPAVPPFEVTKNKVTVFDHILI